MPRYVALLRTVNVGGTGKLPMADLREMCVVAGFENIRTYIASGNVVFTSDQSAAEVEALLFKKVSDYAGKPVSIFVRSAAEIEDVLNRCPYNEQPGNRVLVTFLSQPPQVNVLASVRGMKDEDIALGCREIYVHFPQGISQSKLIIPAATQGTARNMNTVAKLSELVQG